MKLLQLLFFSLFIIACSTSTNSTEETSEATEEMAEETPVEEVMEAEPAEEKTLSTEDEDYLIGIMNELKGIDKFFVRDSYKALFALLQVKEDERANKVEEMLEGINLGPDFYISEYKPKNGYIAYTPGAVEANVDMVYWNVSDGSQLIATQVRSCGPVCDTDLSFSSFKDGNYLPLENVIPDQIMLSEKLAPGSTSDQGDPYEFEFILPIQGKDLKYCLGDDCLTLAWNDGTFTLKE